MRDLTGDLWGACGMVFQVTTAQTMNGYNKIRTNIISSTTKVADEAQNIQL